ncbi:helix-turn-helix domain-containing protein [Streptomyces sp. YIM 121038]|uniref:helix-turn-helix domain-containing protein n=1 Tax=Streptomyces sp. YIM 121038 TaxID=2136401 RepID=UPI0031FE667B
MAYGHRTEHRLRVRAQVVLHAARGRSNARIARETGLHLDTVRRWRGRFARAGLPGLKDRERCGRPASFTPVQAAGVKAVACRLPAESGVPISRWSCPELAREAIARGIVAFVSASTVRRWLRADALKPWQHQSWIFITDPDFRPKAKRVLDLYARIFEGTPLGEDEYVISADEKPPSRPASAATPLFRPGKRGRCASTHLPARRRTRLPRRLRRPRREGVRPYRRTHRHRPVHEPGHPGHAHRALCQRQARVLDRGQRLLPPRPESRRPADRSVPERGHGPHPVHASWLNQIEIYFSVVQRKVVSPNDFTDLAEVRDRLRAFEDRYNATVQPFQWKFTTTDLDDLLARLDRHTADHHEESSVALAA